MAARASKSKKGSGANSTSRQPPDLVFYLDQCLGRKTVAETLRLAGCRVELHADHFAPDAPDSDWLPKVGARGWIVLTKDNHIHRNQIEIAAILRSGAPAFVLRAKKATGLQTAAAFVKALPSMARFIQKFQPPFIATVALSGSVSMLCSLSNLIKRVE